MAQLQVVGNDVFFQGWLVAKLETSPPETVKARFLDELSARTGPPLAPIPMKSSVSPKPRKGKQ